MTSPDFGAMVWRMFGPPAPPPFDPDLLRMGRDLRGQGIEPMRHGREWHQVRRGVWISAASWESLSPVQRHAALVHAAALTLTTEVPLAFAGPSAAAVLGLPRITAWPTDVHVLADPRGRSHPNRRSRGTAKGVRRRAGECVRPVSINGILITPPAKTLADLARLDSLDNALAAADQALRRGLCTHADLHDEIAAIPPRSRGRRAAHLLSLLVDSGSMSAGESLSRLQMFRLNLPRPELQVEFADEEGLIGFTDFTWRGIAGATVVGEFDGRIKYRLDPAAPQDQVERVLWEEKLREDRLRKQARVARWTWAHAWDRVKLARELARHGIRPLPRNTWFDLAAPTVKLG